PNRSRRSPLLCRVPHRRTTAILHWDPAVQSISECTYSRVQLTACHSPTHHRRSKRASGRSGRQRTQTAAAVLQTRRRTAQRVNDTVEPEKLSARLQAETTSLDQASPGPRRPLRSCQDLEHQRTTTYSCRKAS